MGITIGRNWSLTPIERDADRIAVSPLGIGSDHVDLRAAIDRGITVGEVT
jgi:lactate dehydrogenase-like 2-hydroxyacid dehydrogenase